MSKYAIFDLDGCLSDDRWRLGRIPAGAHGDQDYAHYHEGLDQDRSFHHELLEKHAQEHVLLFVTARPESLRSRTEAWLRRHYPALGSVMFTLLMRPNGDTRPSRELKLWLLEQSAVDPDRVAIAYDDRVDVLEAYSAASIPTQRLLVGAAHSPGDVLRNMATTFDERNKGYGSNYRMVGPIMRIMFPEGVPPDLLGTDQFHLFELKVVKMTRFAISGLRHADSIHDDGVYSAMIESILKENEDE